MWAYYHLGLPVFTMDLWGLPKPKEEKKEGSGITLEALEKDVVRRVSRTG
ncbi:MAG: hypothetical protein MZV63_39150 [Marinilabiliales bacterium]|nr:hypothetical protein [Marinilabiliales bacterium]